MKLSVFNSIKTAQALRAPTLDGEKGIHESLGHIGGNPEPIEYKTPGQFLIDRGQELVAGQVDWMCQTKHPAYDFVKARYDAMVKDLQAQIQNTKDQSQTMVAREILAQCKRTQEAMNSGGVLNTLATAGADSLVMQYLRRSLREGVIDYVSSQSPNGLLVARNHIDPQYNTVSTIGSDRSFATVVTPGEDGLYKDFVGNDKYRFAPASEKDQGRAWFGSGSRPELPVGHFTIAPPSKEQIYVSMQNDFSVESLQKKITDLYLKGEIPHDPEVTKVMKAHLDKCTLANQQAQAEGNQLSLPLMRKIMDSLTEEKRSEILYGLSPSADDKNHVYFGGNEVMETKVESMLQKRNLLGQQPVETDMGPEHEKTAVTFACIEGVHPIPLLNGFPLGEMYKTKTMQQRDLNAFANKVLAGHPRAAELMNGLPESIEQIEVELQKEALSMVKDIAANPDNPRTTNRPSFDIVNTEIRSAVWLTHQQGDPSLLASKMQQKVNAIAGKLRELFESFNEPVNEIVKINSSTYIHGRIQKRGLDGYGIGNSTVGTGAFLAADLNPRAGLIDNGVNLNALRIANVNSLAISGVETGASLNSLKRMNEGFLRTEKEYPLDSFEKLCQVPLQIVGGGRLAKCLTHFDAQRKEGNYDEIQRVILNGIRTFDHHLCTKSDPKELAEALRVKTFYQELNKSFFETQAQQSMLEKIAGFTTKPAIAAMDYDAFLSAMKSAKYAGDNKLLDVAMEVQDKASHLSAKTTAQLEQFEKVLEDAQISKEQASHLIKSATSKEIEGALDRYKRVGADEQKVANLREDLNDRNSLLVQAIDLREQIQHSVFASNKDSQIKSLWSESIKKVSGLQNSNPVHHTYVGKTAQLGM